MCMYIQFRQAISPFYSASFKIIFAMSLFEFRLLDTLICCKNTWDTDPLACLAQHTYFWQLWPLGQKKAIQIFEKLSSSEVIYIVKHAKRDFCHVFLQQKCWNKYWLTFYKWVVKFWATTNSPWIVMLFFIFLPGLNNFSPSTVCLSTQYDIFLQHVANFCVNFYHEYLVDSHLLFFPNTEMIDRKCGNYGIFVLI